MAFVSGDRLTRSGAAFEGACLAELDRQLSGQREVDAHVVDLLSDAVRLARENAALAKLALANDGEFEKIARYERGLKAFMRFADAPNVSPEDLREWIDLSFAALLDGLEVECPVCSTHVHEGACVGDGDDGEDEDEDEDADEPPTCDACGDTRGACIHV